MISQCVPVSVLRPTLRVSQHRVRNAVTVTKIEAMAEQLWWMQKCPERRLSSIGGASVASSEQSGSRCDGYCVMVHDGGLGAAWWRWWWRRPECLLRLCSGWIGSGREQAESEPVQCTDCPLARIFLCCFAISANPARTTANCFCITYDTLHHLCNRYLRLGRSEYDDTGDCSFSSEIWSYGFNGN